MSMSRFRVHKFGGSSVADAACMQRVAQILEDDPTPRLAVVLSACRGVTDALLGMVAAAERQESKVLDLVAALRHRHLEIANALLAESTARDYIAELERDLADLQGILQTVRLIRGSSQSVRDLVAGYGEIWSTRLFWRYLAGRGRRPGRVSWIDARDIVQVEWTALGPTVRWEESRARASRAIPADASATLVIPGFIARDENGLQTTLGRNGSDFSASIFGDLLDADDIHIWTDVDGVLSADPGRVPDATVIDALSYQEAMELAYFGAKVIHPQTMAPAVLKGVPIWIRNTFAPEKPGTLIGRRTGSSDPANLVKGITSIERIALVNVEGAGMIGVPGTAQRLFGALREHGISVVLISQGSSEHSICFAISAADLERTEQVLRSTFEAELARNQIQDVAVSRDCSILSVVGDGMAGTPGVAAKLFGALGSAGVNVRAVAQGSSERSISVVIESRDTTRALRSVHSGFYLSPHTISIGLIGPGNVGSVFVEQLASQTARLRGECGLDLRLRGIATSQRMLLADSEIALHGWRDRLRDGQEGRPVDLERFETHVHADHLPHAVIVDCSASTDVATCYPRWLAAGIHVVTPNKKANSAGLSFYGGLKEARRTGRAHYLYEAAVGAGLPVIQTLRDLRETGDDVRRIDGLLSGTLSYLFTTWDGREPFSNVVLDARAKGYTEPDPRDDLSGMDVARKLIILGREIGLAIELGDVSVESLVPEALAAVSADEFLARISEIDAALLARLEAARARGRVLRHVAALDATSGRASVGLTEVEPSHPFGNINRTDNVVRFATARYHDNPLVVQGPGAGPEVTAGAVFADLLRVCAYLGARL
jgi:bifunctional aspartokinase / homoserine dehydrogenase 1